MKSIWMFGLGVVLSSALPAIASSVPAKKEAALRLMANEVHYSYQSFDGAETLSCTHEIENPENPFDWLVKCGEVKGVQKRFSVHLAVSRYRHTTQPEVTYEVLYWVNGNGASSLYDFKKDGELVSIQSGQSLMGVDAELRLTLKLHPQKN